MLFCRDCDFYVEFCTTATIKGEASPIPHCMHEKAADYADPVTGDIPTCRAMREFISTPNMPISDYCGYTGNWWREKKKEPELCKSCRFSQEYASSTFGKDTKLFCLYSFQPLSGCDDNDPLPCSATFPEQCKGNWWTEKKKT